MQVAGPGSVSTGRSLGTSLLGGALVFALSPACPAWTAPSTTDKVLQTTDARLPRSRPLSSVAGSTRNERGALRAGAASSSQAVKASEANGLHSAVPGWLCCLTACTAGAALAVGRCRRQPVSQKGRRASVIAAWASGAVDGGENDATSGEQEASSKKPGKLSVKQMMAKYGVGMVFSYTFLSNVNGCLMFSICWPIFISSTGLSPLLFNPFRLNPKFLVYYGAIYLSLGSIMRMFRFGIAVRITPAFDRMLTYFQDRLGWPRWATSVAMIVAQTVGSIVFLGCALCVTCLLFRTPIWI
ncbi:unnamed protein product [Polarella glacialis]|uniref:Uncharacterized protein n=1 Tax=Polarella glacialis TaxID=89957 RepID=A0A813HCF0_POLGL|nr:unnamed protein product [Polarella glacialis]